MTPVSLKDALERAGIENAIDISDFCQSLSFGLYPHDTMKKEKMSFIFGFTFDRGEKTEEGKLKNPFVVLNKTLDENEPTLQNMSWFCGVYWMHSGLFLTLSLKTFIEDWTKRWNGRREMLKYGVVSHQ